MHIFPAAAPFLKISVVFCVMLAGIRCRLGLGISILAGSLALALFFGLPITDWLAAGGRAMIEERFLLLLTIVMLILILSDALEHSGQSGRLMKELTGYLTNPRLRLVFFPALIGLLPMPGGAVFSAPLVKAVASDMRLNNQQQAVINYWFRHVWEMVWPLYPGIILTVSLAGIPIGTLISRTWPATVAMFSLGWYFFLRPRVLEIAPTVAEKPAEDVKNPAAIFRESVPLLIAIVGSIGLETFMSVFVPDRPFEWGIIAALAAAVAAVMVQNRLGIRYLGTVLSRKSFQSMLFVIAAIFVFKEVLQAAGVVEAMAGSAGNGAALFAAAVFLPFLVGVVAGINVAFVGSTFPLLLGLLKSMGLETETIPYLVLATFWGFTGVMVSPLHICFVLTCNFFGAESGRTWRRIIVPCIVFVLTGCTVFLILLKL